MAVLFVLVIVFRPSGLMGGREVDIRGMVRRIAAAARGKGAA
jgi:hypothetical protein